MRRNGRGRASRRLAVAPITSMPRGVGTPFRYERKFVYQSNTLAVGSPFLAALGFGMNTWPSAFATLIGASYDFFRIDGVTVTFIPYFNVNGTNSVGVDDQLPQIAWVSNYDDNSAPVSYDAVLAQTGSRFRRFDRPISHSVVPRALSAVAAAGGNTNALLIGPGAWFNAGGPAVLFLGLKYGITALSGTPAGGRFDVNYSIHLTCIQNIV